MEMPLHSMIVLTDLDDTLFTSRRKAKGYKGSAASRLVCENSKTERDTVQLPFQAKLENMLRIADCVVPITGRTYQSLIKAYGNKDFSIGFAHFGGWAVTKDDAEIFYCDLADKWNQFSSEQRQLGAKTFASISGYLERVIAQLPYLVRFKENKAPDGLVNEIVIKFESQEDRLHYGWVNLKDAIELFYKDCLDDVSPFEMHINNNNLTLLLRSINKGEAAKYFLDALDTADALVIGAGDSLTDLSFMRYADAMVIPVASQIAKRIPNEH